MLRDATFIPSTQILRLVYKYTPFYYKIDPMTSVPTPNQVSDRDYIFRRKLLQQIKYYDIIGWTL